MQSITNSRSAGASRHALRLLVLLLLLLPTLPAWGQEEKYFGFDLDLVAKATSRLTSYRTQFGESRGNQEFESWLGQQGLSRQGYTQAYNAYWERFKADASGKLEAKFHLAIQKYTQEFDYGDVPKRDQEKHGGVTLERYAEISVALSRQPGADVEKVLKEYGVAGLAGWQKINAAWGEAFKNDKTAALAMQYGQLYQKYAGPAFAKEQEQQLADSLAGRFDKKPEPPSAPPERPTLAQLHEALTSKVQSERWEAARPLAFECQRFLRFTSEKERKGDARWAHCQPGVLRQDWLPVVLDIVDHVPEDKLHLATGLLDSVESLGFGKDAKLTYQRCLNRLKSSLETLEASFAPIQDKAVPERIVLRTKIDDHRAAIGEIEREIADWK